MTEGADAKNGSAPKDPNKRYCKNCGKVLPKAAPLTRKYCDNDGTCRSEYIQRLTNKRRMAEHERNVKSGHDT